MPHPVCGTSGVRPPGRTEKARAMEDRDISGWNWRQPGKRKKGRLAGGLFLIASS